MKHQYNPVRIQYTQLCLSFILINVLSVGAWESLEDLEDGELQSLAARLPETVLRCRVTSATKKYLGAYKR